MLKKEYYKGAGKREGCQESAEIYLYTYIYIYIITFCTLKHSFDINFVNIKMYYYF
jgi:hypothetical protein